MSREEETLGLESSYGNIRHPNAESALTQAIADCSASLSIGESNSKPSSINLAGTTR